ncbi:MAG: hypothetical protein ACE5I3_05925 [Phycisphaerae bacterium]
MMLPQESFKAELPDNLERATAVAMVRPAVEADGFRFLRADPDSPNAPCLIFKAQDCPLTLYLVNHRRYGSMYTFILDFELGWLGSALAGGLPVNRFPYQVVRRIVLELRRRGARARRYHIAEEAEDKPV